MTKKILKTTKAKSQPIPYIFRQVPFSLWKQILTDEAYKQFCHWMGGQTCGCTEDLSEGCPYPWDVERWIRQGCKKEQGPDWD